MTVAAAACRANQVSTFTEDVGGQWFPLLYHMTKDWQKVCGNHLLNFMKLHWPSTGECFEVCIKIVMQQNGLTQKKD